MRDPEELDGRWYSEHERCDTCHGWGGEYWRPFPTSRKAYVRMFREAEDGVVVCNQCDLGDSDTGARFVAVMPDVLDSMKRDRED